MILVVVLVHSVPANRVQVRDRIDETVNRIRSVRGKRYHYIRNYYPDRHFTSLNRYKEKCFPIKPLMRKLMAEGKLIAEGRPGDVAANPAVIDAYLGRQHGEAAIPVTKTETADERPGEGGDA